MNILVFLCSHSKGRLCRWWYQLGLRYADTHRRVVGHGVSKAYRIVVQDCRSCSIYTSAARAMDASAWQTLPLTAAWHPCITLQTTPEFVSLEFRKLILFSDSSGNATVRVLRQRLPLEARLTFSTGRLKRINYM